MSKYNTSTQIRSRYISTFKKNPECFAMLIWIYLRLNKHREAHNEIKRMIEHFPNDTSFRETALACMYMISANKEALACSDPVEKRMKLQN